MTILFTIYAVIGLFLWGSLFMRAVSSIAPDDHRVAAVFSLLFVSAAISATWPLSLPAWVIYECCDL